MPASAVPSQTCSASPTSAASHRHKRLGQYHPLLESWRTTDRDSVHHVDDPWLNFKSDPAKLVRSDVISIK